MLRNLSFLLLLFTTYNALAHELFDQPGELIRVGVWNNPPLVFKDKKGEWHGITIDILRAIANEKRWSLEFVAGSFSDNLQMLESDQIDLLSTIAFSSKRAETYNFTKSSLISNWGLIYTHPDAKINSLLDLEGKKIAVMRNNIHDRAFRNLTTEFSIDFIHIEKDNFNDVMNSTSHHEVDEGVVNRLFGALNAPHYNVVETGIIFNPINIHYATLHSQHNGILDAIDRRLVSYKADKNSVYYKTIQRWLNPTTSQGLPDWLRWIFLVLVSIFVLMAAMTLLLRRQVSLRTLALQKEVDERKLAQERLDCLAYYDLLTGLPNRASFLNNLKTAIASARRHNLKLAVLFIDLDRFKTINDSLGHDTGDQLIIHVSKRLQQCLREEDILTRFGGDEFIAILPDIRNLLDIDHVSNRMLECLNTPIKIHNNEIYSSVSIGITLFPDDNDSGEHLLKYADAAMYHAKEKGGNNYQFYNTEFTNRIEKRFDLENRLRRAIERDELVLYYQPIMNLKSDKITGVEALVRWQDPEHGLLAPDHFIPLAEETGLITEIGAWVLEHACTQIRKWDSKSLPKLNLAVNISSQQFQHSNLYKTVFSTLDKTGLAPKRLELEITEEMFLNITANVQQDLYRLKNQGISLSIDDFGTGYSSLSYLKQLPIDTLKIDKSFVQGIPEDKDNIQIASTIVSMTHGLGLTVVAEGIETSAQMEFIKSLKCERGQGFYIARPMPADELEKWLTSQI